MTRTGKRTARSASLAMRSLLLVYKRTSPSDAPAAISPFERTETHQTEDTSETLAFSDSEMVLRCSARTAYPKRLEP